MSNDAVFCPKCGNKRKEIEDTERKEFENMEGKKQEQEEKDAEASKRKNENEKSKNNKKNNIHKPINYILIAVGLVAFGYVLYSLVDAFVVVNGYKNNLLRPESLNVREAYTFDGTFYNHSNDTSNASTEKYFPNKKHYVLLYCTLENAGGRMTEEYVLYDRDTGNYYSSKDIPRSVGQAKPWTELTYEETFYYNTVWSDFETTQIREWKKEFKYRKNIWYKIF